MSVIDTVLAWAADRGVTHARKADDGADAEHVVVELPGEKKLKTSVLLTASRHGLRVEAFVCRHPDENIEQFQRYLLVRNRKLYGVAYTVDNVGDVYLVGRVATENVTVDELDRVLGQVLAAADGDFNPLLEIGFITSIRKEWAWRTSRGESLRNLEAFEHLISETADSASSISERADSARPVERDGV